MIFVTEHLEDANQSNNDISFQTAEIRTLPKEQEHTVLVWMRGERDSHSLLVGMSPGSDFLEDNMEIPQKM